MSVLLRWAGVLCAGGGVVLISACGPAVADPSTIVVPTRTSASVALTSDPPTTTTTTTTTTTPPPPPPTTTHHVVVRHTTTTHPTHTTTKPAPPPAPRPARTKCTASMTNAAPTENSRTDVIVHTSPDATVSATAHYKSKDTSHSGTANGSGTADIEFLTSHATGGFRVVVSVSVTAHGTSGSCSTSFTPPKS